MNNDLNLVYQPIAPTRSFGALPSIKAFQQSLRQSPQRPDLKRNSQSPRPITTSLKKLLPDAKEGGDGMPLVTNIQPLFNDQKTDQKLDDQYKKKLEETNRKQLMSTSSYLDQSSVSGKKNLLPSYPAPTQDDDQQPHAY